MRTLAVSRNASRFAMPTLLVISLLGGLLLPAVAKAAPPGKDKPVVEQMRGRTNYRANPWAVSGQSCDNKRYYTRYPQRTQTYWQPRYPNNRYYDQDRYHNDRYDNDRYDNERCNGFYYRVRRGDTLSEIARRYGVSEGALASANHLRNRNHIYAGQSLYIPGVGYCR